MHLEQMMCDFLWYVFFFFYLICRNYSVIYFTLTYVLLREKIDMAFFSNWLYETDLFIMKIVVEYNSFRKKSLTNKANNYFLKNVITWCPLFYTAH